MSLPRVLRSSIGWAAACVAVWLSLASVAPLEHADAVGIAGPGGWTLGAGLVALVLALGALDGFHAGGAGLTLAVFAAPLLAPGLPGTWLAAGPAALLVWTTLVAVGGGSGVGGGRVAGVLRVSPTTASALPFVFALAWLSVVAWRLGPAAMTGDVPHYLTATHSLRHDGDLDLRNDYDSRTFGEFYSGSLEPRHTNDSPWGAQYSFHGPGVSVLVLPGYALWGVPGASATLVVLLSMGAALMWRTIRRLTNDNGAAWIGWTALVFAAPYSLHSAAIYPDGPAAVAVAAALWLMVRAADPRAVPLPSIAAVGAGLGALPWLHARFALPAAIFGAAALWTVGRRQPEPLTRMLWFMMAPVISCAGWFAAAYVMFDTWNPAAAILQRTAPGLLSAAPAGVFGLLVDREYGLLPTSPVFVAAPLGWLALLRARGSVAHATAAALVGTAVMAGLWGWWGGVSAPARLLTTTVPALALWIGVLWATLGPRGQRVLRWAAAWTVATNVLLVFVGGGATAYNHPDGQRTVFDAFSSVVNAAAALPSMFAAGATVASELPIALVWLAAIGVAAAAVAAPRRDSPTSTGIAAVASLAILGAAAALCWHLRGIAPWTPGIAQHDLLARLSQGVPSLTASLREGVDVGPPLESLRIRTPENVVRDAGVLLYVPNVPPGRYVIGGEATRRQDGEGSLTLYLGRDAEPYRTWSVWSEHARVITLARPLHSVRVLGPPNTGDLWLSPLAMRLGRSSAAARRVTRIGAIDIYSLDDSSYVDGDGLWLGGDRAATFVVAPDALMSVVARLQAGPAAVRVTATAHGSRRTVDLDAMAAAQLPLGQASLDAPLEVTFEMRGSFAASTIWPGDARTFGVRLTLATPSTPSR